MQMKKIVSKNMASPCGMKMMFKFTSTTNKI